MLGVLGGMGPLATADFLAKLVECTPSKKDADHLPVLVRAIPQIPDRTAAILNDGASPLPDLVRHARSLKREGAQMGVMPCNTAHHWYDELVIQSGLPFLHIADAVIESIRTRGFEGGSVGLLATPGTLRSGIYQTKLAASGFHCQTDTTGLEEVYHGIQMVKTGDFTKAHGIFCRAVDRLMADGASVVILGCTELPTVLRGQDECIDSTLALAQACVSHFNALSPTEPPFIGGADETAGKALGREWSSAFPT